MQQLVSGQDYRPAGRLDAQRALERYNGPWDERRAAHLFRRAGFGGSPEQITQAQRQGLHTTLEELINYPLQSRLPGRPANLTNVEALAAQYPKPYTLEQRRILRKASLENGRLLQTWWLERMLRTPAPLQEKMTLFWHGHFTSALQEKGIDAQAILRQNQLFRTYATGNIRTLTQDVAQDPAMLLYLDNARSSKAHPNENFARELMELFTLGIGNYSETDVRESARAFTGWGLNKSQKFSVFPNRHDTGQKTFLGHTGPFDGKDIINIIFTQPACSRYFAKKLLEFFVYENPEPALIDALASELRFSGFELKPVLAKLFSSEVFYSARAYRALVKSPVEFVLGGLKMLGLKHVNHAVLQTLNKSGQNLFYPPNVKGWDGGAAWLNSGTLLLRDNFINQLVHDPELRKTNSLFNQIPLDATQGAQRIIDIVLQGDCSPASLARLVRYLDGDTTAANHMLSIENFEERIRGGFYLAMTMPAFQLN